MSGITDVEVWSYYDGIVSGSLRLNGERHGFELAAESAAISDDERIYVAWPIGGDGDVVRLRERMLNAAVKAQREAKS